MKEQEEEFNPKYDPDKFPKDLYEKKDENEVLFLEKQGRGFGKGSKEILDDIITTAPKRDRKRERWLLITRGETKKKLKRARSPKVIKKYEKIIADAENELVSSNLWFVRLIAYQEFFKAFLNNDDLDIVELIQVGTLGLRKAIDDYRYDRFEVLLTTYAGRPIRQAIKKFIKSPHRIKEERFKAKIDEDGEVEERPEENTLLVTDDKYYNTYDLYKKDYVNYLMKNTPNLTKREKRALELRYVKNYKLYEIARKFHISEKRTTDINDIIDSALIKIQKANRINTKDIVYLKMIPTGASQVHKILLSEKKKGG